MQLSLEITLRNGDKKVLPLISRASDYLQAGSWHEYLIPAISDINNIHLEQFTQTDCGMLWEIIVGNFIEGLESSGEVNWDEEDDVAGCHLSWQMLLDGKPATYAEVDQSLNCDYWLHITSTAFEGHGCIPLDKGRWAINDKGAYYLDKTFHGLELADAIYDIAEVGEEHYSKVLDILEPLFKRETEYMKVTVDGITYTFTLSRCEEVSA